MKSRNTAEFHKLEQKVDGENPLYAGRDSAISDFKTTGEYCRNGVCSVTWKPAKPSAA